MSTFHLHSVPNGGSNPTLYQQPPLCEREFGVRALLLGSAGAAGNFAMTSTTTSGSGDKQVIPRVGLVPDTKVLPLNSVVRLFNRFFLDDKSTVPIYKGMSFMDSPRMKECLPFIVDGYRVGLINDKVLKGLMEYPDVFSVNEECVTLSSNLNTYESRSESLAQVLKDMRSKNMFVTLKGWRNECFEARINLEEPSLFRMERAATCMFGIRQFGVDISGYVHHPEKGLCVWMQRRSSSKQRWPGMWDNMVGGGLAAGFSVLETAHKEAAEEASIPLHLLKNLKEAGCVSIFFESERGLSPNTEFVYDLELPLDFVPKNQDGEVSEFQLLPAYEALKLVLSPMFKTTSCPVALDFLIRHGVLTSEIEPELETYKSFMRIPLKDFYQKLDNKNNITSA